MGFMAACLGARGFGALRAPDSVGWLCACFARIAASLGHLLQGVNGRASAGQPRLVGQPATLVAPHAAAARMGGNFSDCRDACDEERSQGRAVWWMPRKGGVFREQTRAVQACAPGTAVGRGRLLPSQPLARAVCVCVCVRYFRVAAAGSRRGVVPRGVRQRAQVLRRSERGQGGNCARRRRLAFGSACGWRLRPHEPLDIRHVS